MIQQRFLDVSQAGDLPTFERRLVDFAHDMDFGYVSSALAIDRPGQKAVFMMLNNAPEAFADATRDEEDAKRDPVLKRLKRLSVPFVYDQSTYVSDGAADLWERQAEFGYRTGISVALHLPGHKHFLLGVDRAETLPEDDEKLTRMLADIQLLAVHAQDAAVRLLTPAAPESEIPTLTPRELEVLRWTMEGKSAWEVGQILSVSEHTVNFHMRNILRKLDSTSKHQAVLKAIALEML